MQILIVNFNLDGLSEEEFASSCDELAPAFAAVPGLASKVWLADRAEGIFGGVYTFGPDSVDGWLNRIAAAELGESVQPFLDERDRSVDLGGARIQLSPLEFGVLSTLAAHPAAPVSRADLLREVWGTSYDGGSNTVDVVIRSLRRKLGAVADRIETVRGVGYRLR